MGRLKRRWIGVAIVGALPLVASAQSPFNLDPSNDKVKEIEMGGTAAIDIITLKAVGPGAPLRYGNVIEKSERVQLGGQMLTVGVDYMMDYATGVVYLKRAQKAGQILTVAYRYKEGAAATSAAAGNPFAGIGAFKYSVAPGSLNMLMGFGLTERAADGTVMQSNVFGWQNSFSLSGGGALKGLYVYGDRQKSTNQMGMNYSLNGKPGDATTEEGKSQLLLQSLQTQLGGGKISVDYQDVSKNFTNFGTVKNSGADDATVQRLTKERGLTRFGYAAENIGGFSSAFKNVKDEKGGLSWRSFGYNQGALKVNWSSQKIDKGFARFQDISEGDREQLAREVGMSRQNLSSEFAAKAAKLSYSAKVLQDEQTGKEITRKEYALDTSRIKMQFGQQDVADGFNRFQSLLGDEQAKYGKEAGLSRQWMGLQASLGASMPLSFSQSIIKNGTGEYKGQDVMASGKSWSLEHVSRKVDAGFNRLDSMQDNEIAKDINSVAKMYGQANPNVGAERGFFIRSNGLERTYTTLSAQPFKDWKFGADYLKLDGQKDGASVNTINLNGKNANFSYRKQQLGAKFDELTSVMEFERQRLGTIAGLDRTDFGMNLALGGSKKLDFNQMKAGTDKNSASRTSVAFKDKKIDVQVNTREVSSGFSNVNQLVDPEKDFLATMTGFKQTEGKLSWQLNASFSIQAYLSEMRNEETNELRRIRNMILDWSPDSKTKLNYVSYAANNDDPLAVLFANNVQRLTVARNLGKYGNLLFQDETVKFDGKNATQPDYHKQYMAYETKVNEKTTVKTEQTRTSFENGDKENINANTLSTELTKRVGVSVTDVNVDRNGDERDEKKRNYGFWFDLGNGLRMSYGYIRNLNGEAAGAYSSSMAIGANAGVVAANQTNAVQQGNAGGMQIAGGYGVNNWDEQNGRTQSFSNVNISTAKPFQFFGFRNVRFNLGLDTAADQKAWLRENRLVSATGEIAKNSLGFEYKSQIHPSGYRGIDRTFTFATDPSDKKWLHATMRYKVRTLPWDEIVAIRDFNVSAKPTKNLELSHQMQTNPEVFKSDVFLGSVPQAARANKWRLDYKTNPNFTLGASWDELLDEQNKTSTRTAGVNMKFFEAKGSPLSLYYGLEQGANTSQRQTTHRYSIKFDQKMGGNSNQIFSLFLGNVSYEHRLAAENLRNNWTARLDYQIKF